MTQAYDLVIENGTIWTSTTSYPSDIAVSGGRIIAIGGPFPDAKTRIDASGRQVLPGVWHVHCHFRDPGHTYKEDFATGTRTAAAGGITMCLDMTKQHATPDHARGF